MNYTKLFKDAWSLIWQRPLPWVFAFFLPLVNLFDFIPRSHSTAYYCLIPFILIGSVILTSLSPVGQIISLQSIHLKQPTSFQDIYKIFKKKFWKVFAASFMVGLPIGLGYGIWISISRVLQMGAAGNAIFGFVGLALIIPASFVFYYSTYIIVIQDQKATNAVISAYNLVFANSGPVYMIGVTLLLIRGILIFAFSFITSGLVYTFILSTTPTIKFLGVPWSSESLVQFFVNQGIGLIFGLYSIALIVLAYPIFSAKVTPQEAIPDPNP